MSVSAEPTPRRVVWSDAIAVASVVVPVLLAARALRPLVETGAFYLATGESLRSLPGATWPRAVAWLLIVVAIGLRWRAVAAVGAWAAVAYELFVSWQRLYGDPVYVVPAQLALWPLGLALVGAILLTLGPKPAGRGLDVVGRPGRWVLAGAAVLAAGSAGAIPFLGDYYGPPSPDSVDPGFSISFTVSTGVARAVTVVTVLGVGLLTLAVLGLAARNRRRAV